MEKTVQLSEQELKVFKIMRSMENGELRIIVKDNRPIRIEQIQKSIELNE